MATPFSIDGVLNLPGTPGLPADPLPFGLSSSYDSKVEFEYNLPGVPGTKTVDFGTMPAAGAKAVLVSYDPKNGAPVIAVTLNGANQPVELSSGGFFVFGSPAPSAGITAMSIAHTGAGRVRVWLLGLLGDGVADVTDLVLTKVLPPLLSGAVGVAGTAWRYAKGLTDRLSLVEGWVKKFNEQFALEGPRPTHAADALKRSIDELQRDVKETNEDLKRRFREVSEARRLQARFAERCLAIESRLDTCEKSINELNTAFISFSKEQQEQWQDMTRTLGQVEGYLKAKTSTTFHPTKK